MINRDAQENFRLSYRNKIANWYNGYLHIAIIFGIGFSLLFIYLQYIDQPSIFDFLTIPITFIAANFFEWYLHKVIMHKPQKKIGLRAIYQRHTHNHHNFFTDNEMRFRDSDDWRVTVFPPYALIVFVLISSIGLVTLSFIFNSNVGWFFIFTTTSIYLLYEFMHFCCHVNENWFVRNCPLINTIRRHHTVHHNNQLMREINLNLTFPIADYFFGTSDLDRGFLGHLLNGYSTKYQKTNLRTNPKTPGHNCDSPNF